MKMRKVVAAIICGFIALGSSWSADADLPDEGYAETAAVSDDALLPAFPGAEGAGKYATGGRGGEIYHVTNLNDSGAGSLRDAVSKSNRIVIFDVGGTITLKSDLSINGNITIMGQTAPGGAGVTVRNGKLAFAGDNIIVRYLASRPGEKGAGEYDAWGGSKGSNSIIDHCSIGWANDEQFGLYSPYFLTVQYSIIGPANCLSTHDKGCHGFGPMIGAGENSWHHNLICHNMSRNFRGKMEGSHVLDYVNNVIYGWGGETAYGTFGRENYVGNYFKKSISTRNGNNFGELKSGSNYDKVKFYLTGNKMVDRNGKDTNSAMNQDNWNGGLSLNRSLLYYESYYRSSYHFPIMSNGVDVSVAKNPETADEAFLNVTSYAGAAINPTTRTKIDAEVLNDALTGSGSLTGGMKSGSSTTSDEISKYSIKYVNYDEYYPEAITKKQIMDSDNDGMPDEWETARGLNPNDAGDANGSYLADGYTNIEHYCNDLTVNSFPSGVVTVSPTLDELGDDYNLAISDANALTLSKTKIESASDLKLPVSVPNGSKIVWSSSSDCVVIEDNQITRVIQPTGVNNDTAYLKAEITNGSCKLIKRFTLTVRSATTSWFASSGNDGAKAGTQLMSGLTTVSDLQAKALSTAVNLDGSSRSYYVTAGVNGGYSDGVGTGTCLKYTASADGKLYLYAADLADTKALYIVPEGVDDFKSNYAGMKAGNNGTTTVSANVKAGTTYYLFPSGTKGELVGVKFVKKTEQAAEDKTITKSEIWSFNDIEQNTNFAKNDVLLSNNGQKLTIGSISEGDAVKIAERGSGNNYLQIADKGTGRVSWSYTPETPLKGDKVIFEFEFNKSDINKDTSLLRVYDSVNANKDNTFSSGSIIFELKTASNQGSSSSDASDLVLTDYFTEGSTSTADSPKGADFSFSNFSYKKDTWYGIRLEYFKNENGGHEVALYTKTESSSNYTYRDSVVLGSGRTKADLDSVILTPTKVDFRTPGSGTVTLGLDNLSIGTETKSGGDTDPTPTPTSTPDSGIKYTFIQNGAEVKCFSEGQVTCCVNAADMTEYKMMAAEYDQNGVLLKLSETEASASEVVLTPSAYTDTIRVFVWDSLDTIEPLDVFGEIKREK